MNKLKTTDLGGFPINLDDFRFEQASVRDAFIGLLSAFGIAANETFIISGVNPVYTSGVGITWSAGWVSILGEVCKVDAGSLAHTTVPAKLKWDILSTFDSAGIKTFKDGGSHSTYEVRKATIVAYTGTPSSSTFTPYNANTLATLIKNMALPAEIQEMTPTSAEMAGIGVSSGIPVISLDPSGTYKVLYYFVGPLCFISYEITDLSLSGVDSLIYFYLKMPPGVYGKVLPIRAFGTGLFSNYASDRLAEASGFPDQADTQILIGDKFGNFGDCLRIGNIREAHDVLNVSGTAGKAFRGAICFPWISVATPY